MTTTNDTRKASELTGEGLQAEGLRIARAYLSRRGYVVCDGTAEGFGAVAEEDGTTVLVDVSTALSTGGPDALPQLACDADACREYRRRGLLYLAAHQSVRSLRVDVISIAIVGDTSAKLRHLVGAFCWEE